MLFNASRHSAARAALFKLTLGSDVATGTLVVRAIQS
jgi:hypothetical protein